MSSELLGQRVAQQNVLVQPTSRMYNLTLQRNGCGNVRVLF
jgi:hypothetical protein